MFDFFLAAKYVVKTFLQNEQKILRICRQQRPEHSPCQELGRAGSLLSAATSMAPLVMFRELVHSYDFIPRQPHVQMPT